MDNTQRPDALTSDDEQRLISSIDERLRAALAVEPSPGFEARLRARIADQPRARSVWSAWWWPVAVAATVTLAIGAALINRGEELVVTTPPVAMTSVPTAPPAPSPPVEAAPSTISAAAKPAAPAAPASPKLAKDPESEGGPKLAQVLASEGGPKLAKGPESEGGPKLAQVLASEGGPKLAQGPESEGGLPRSGARPETQVQVEPGQEDAIRRFVALVNQGQIDASSVLSSVDSGEPQGVTLIESTIVPVTIQPLFPVSDGEKPTVKEE